MLETLPGTGFSRHWLREDLMIHRLLAQLRNLGPEVLLEQAAGLPIAWILPGVVAAFYNLLLEAKGGDELHAVLLAEKKRRKRRGD